MLNRHSEIYLVMESCQLKSEPNERAFTISNIFCCFPNFRFLHTNIVIIQVLALALNLYYTYYDLEP